MKKEFRRLPCKLTPDELRARGKSLAVQVEDYKRVEVEKTASAQSFAAALKLARARIDDLARVVDSCEERRDVECIFERDEKRWEIVWRRADTWDEVERRPMTETERQMPLRGLDDDAAENDAEPKPH